jgi:hypothetical protein
MPASLTRYYQPSYLYDTATGWTTNSASTQYFIPNKYSTAIPQQYYTTAVTTATYQTNETWRHWNNSTIYRPTQTYGDDVWQVWVDYQGASQFALTPEQAQAQREATERYETQRREERERRAAARARARILLGEFLTEEQKVELERHGHFHVVGSKGRRYCIRASGQSGNVDLLRADGTVQATLCCHPREALPNEDAWLMQMIELRHDEDHFLRTANVHRGSLGHLALR